MAKAPPLAIVYLIVAIHLFFQRKYLRNYWPLLPLALIFTWTYDLFVLLVMAAVFLGGSDCDGPSGGLNGGHWFLCWLAVLREWSSILTSHTTCNCSYEHMKIKLTMSDFDTKVGSEWYPYDSWEFLGNSVVACIAMLAGYIAFDPSDRKRAHYSDLLPAVFNGADDHDCALERIAEYWPPFAVMFAAFLASAMVQGPVRIHAPAA